MFLHLIIKIIVTNRHFLPFLSDIHRLSKIKDELPDHIEYGHIKMVVASLVRQFGQFVNEEGDVTLEIGSGLESAKENSQGSASV